MIQNVLRRPNTKLLERLGGRIISAIAGLSAVKCPECSAQSFTFIPFGRDLKIICTGPVIEPHEYDAECGFTVIVYATTLEKMPEPKWAEISEPSTEIVIR